MNKEVGWGVEAVDPQREEFEAVAALSQRFRSLPAIVDDDYPEARHYYESAVQRILRAFEKNGRMKQSGLTFDEFRAANVARCLKWHPHGIQSWSPSDWLTAVTGELGELASLLKMRNRERDGLPGNKFSPTDRQVADEIADVATYLDLPLISGRAAPRLSR